MTLNLTFDQWEALGLHPAQYAPWLLAPATARVDAAAVRSVVIGEGWLVVYPDPGDRKRDVVAGIRMMGQQARDAAEILRTGGTPD